MPISSLWHRCTVNSGAPSPLEFLVVFVLYTASRFARFATPLLYLISLQSNEGNNETNRSREWILGAFLFLAALNVSRPR